MRVIDFFDEAVAKNPERMLVCEADGSNPFTFAQGKERSIALGRGLRAHGIAVGDRVGILAPNSSDSLVAMLAIWRIGGVWVPLNPRNSVEDIASFGREVGMKTLIVHPQFGPHVETLRDQVPTIESVFALNGHIDGVGSAAELEAAGSTVELEDWNDVHGRLDDLALLAATGGTTGSSKPVMVTNGVWATLMDITSRHFPATEQPVHLISAPMTHAAGVLAALLASQGAGSVVLPGFSAADVLDTIERWRVTHIFMPPTALYDLIDEQRRKPRDLSSMRLLWLAAAPVAPARLKEAVEVLGPWIGQSFGQAEVPAFVTWMTPEEVAAAARESGELLTSCGRPTWGTQVAIMSDDGALLPPGEAGEIVVRGRLVTPGYYNLPDKTADVREYGWHHTGDVGRVDAQGYYYILDRKKDMIISGGFNVFPSEVEAAMMQLPEITKCAVVGVPDDRWGELVTAVVVAAEGHEVDEHAVIAATKQRIGSVKAPKSVVVVDTLPLTAAGKIDKRAIRAGYWRDRNRNV